MENSLIISICGLNETKKSVVSLNTTDYYRLHISGIQRWEGSWFIQSNMMATKEEINNFIQSKQKEKYNSINPNGSLLVSFNSGASRIDQNSQFIEGSCMKCNKCHSFVIFLVDKMEIKNGNSDIYFKIPCAPSNYYGILQSWKIYFHLTITGKNQCHN